MTVATDMLAAYMAAELSLLQGKETRMGDRSLRFEDLAEIRAGRKEWEARVSTEAAAYGGNLRVTYARLDEDW